MDWREILKTNVTHAGELEDIMHLNGEHEQEVERILERFPMSVPRYYLSLIDWNNPKDPIPAYVHPLSGRKRHDGEV